LLFVVGVAVDQLLTLGNSLQNTFADQNAIMATPVGRAYEWVIARLGLDTKAVVDWGSQNASAVAGVVAGYTVAIATSVTGAVIIDNFLRPKLVGGRVGLSELVMFFALLGGLRLFGVLGIVLGPVLFAIAASIIDVLSARPVERT